MSTARKCLAVRLLSTGLFTLLFSLSSMAVVPSALAQLVGGNTYPINGTQNPPASFATLTSAVSYMITNGVTGTGQIVLELSPGYENSPEPGPLTIPQIAGFSAALGVTIRPASGYMATTSIAGTSPSPFAVRVTGSYITLDGRAGGSGTDRNWTIRCTGSGASGYGESAVRVDNTPNPISGVTVRHCVLEAEAASNNSSILALTGGGNLLTNVTLERNLIRSMGSGTNNCRCSGIDVTAVSNSNNSGLVIRDNQIDLVARFGISLWEPASCSGAEISGNEIFHTVPVIQPNPNYFCGIIFVTSRMPGVSINANFIHDIQLTNVTSFVSGFYLATGNATGNRVRIFNNRIDLGAGIQPTTVPIYGFVTNTATGLFDIDYNSVYVGGSPTSGSTNSAAFCKQADGISLNMRNNVFFNARSNAGSATGTHWGISINSANGFGNLNYNDYCANGVGGVLGTTNGGASGNKHTIESWKAAVPLDAQSISQDPHYRNPGTVPPDLSIDSTIPTRLESGGMLVTGIDSDFEGDTRWGSVGYQGTGSAPDIGADEFAGTPLSWVPLVGGMVYPVNGTENAPASFASLSSALTYLYANGAAGTGQVFLELSGAYAGEPGPVSMDMVAGLSATLGLTVRPAVGYTATTSIAGTSPSPFAVRVTGSYITLDGRAGGSGTDRKWTIRCTGSGASGYGESAVRVDNTPNAMTTVAVRYCVLEAEAASNNSGILALTGGGNLLTNVTLERNLIRSMGSGTNNCRCSGIDVTAVSNNNNSGLVIRDNQIDLVARFGISLWEPASCSGAEISGNEIFHTVPVIQPNPNYFCGIIFVTSRMPGVSVSANFIHDIQLTNVTSFVSGFYLATGNATGNRVRIFNNRIDLGAGIQPTTVPIYGFVTNTATGLFDIDYNSVYVGGSPTSGSTNSAAFCKQADGISLNMRNNIFFNARSNAGSATGTHWGISINSTNGFVTLNHNDYYVSGVGGVLGTTNSGTSGNRSIMYQWSTAVPMDDHSFGCDPHFRNPTASPPDLSIDGTEVSPLESNAIPLDWVAVDFQDESRQGYAGYQGTGTAPDIGADEFEGVPPPADVLPSTPLFTSMAQSIPNPAHRATTIRYQLATAGTVAIRIYTADGREVRSLVDEWREPGHYETAWDGDDDEGHRVAAGVYYCELRAPGYRGVKSMVVTR